MSNMCSIITNVQYFRLLGWIADSFRERLFCAHFDVMSIFGHVELLLKASPEYMEEHAYILLKQTYCLSSFRSGGYKP